LLVVAAVDEEQYDEGNQPVVAPDVEARSLSQIESACQ
jgi:hypothetical protein